MSGEIRDLEEGSEVLSQWLTLSWFASCVAYQSYWTVDSILIVTILYLSVYEVPHRSLKKLKFKTSALSMFLFSLSSSHTSSLAMPPWGCEAFLLIKTLGLKTATNIYQLFPEQIHGCFCLVCSRISLVLLHFHSVKIWHLNILLKFKENDILDWK